MSERLTVDWTSCRARGLCAELLPEAVTLDEWGYPLIDGAPLSGAVLRHARRAARQCPTLALSLRRNGPA